jgi:hypothetical protein
VEELAEENEHSQTYCTELMARKGKQTHTATKKQYE